MKYSFIPCFNSLYLFSLINTTFDPFLLASLIAGPAGFTTCTIIISCILSHSKDQKKRIKKLLLTKIFTLSLCIIDCVPSQSSSSSYIYIYIYGFFVWLGNSYYLWIFNFLLTKRKIKSNAVR